MRSTGSGSEVSAVADKSKDEAATPDGEATAAFADLIDATRRPSVKSGFGGGALERRSISEQVANRIMAMIKSGNLKAGDRLPTEAQMGIAFGISRPPLREALKALTLMGVLESRQGASCSRSATTTSTSISRRAGSSIWSWSDFVACARRSHNASASYSTPWTERPSMTTPSPFVCSTSSSTDR
jgi:DNA-binding transcriptional regulator YhcF (GntR family)